MQRSAFQADNGHRSVLQNLIEYDFAVVLRLVLKGREGAYAQHVAVLAHHCNSVSDVLLGAAVHYRAISHLQGPGIGPGVEHPGLRAEVVSRLHRTEAGAQAGVEEDEANGFVAPDVLVAVGIGLDFQRLLQQGFIVVRVGEGSKVFHEVCIV